MKETISGLHVKDYHDLGLEALEEIICLEEQLQHQIIELATMLENGEIDKAKRNLKWLHEDSCSLARWATQCQTDSLEIMEAESREPDLKKMAEIRALNKNVISDKQRLANLHELKNYYPTKEDVHESLKPDILTSEEVAAIRLMRIIGKRIEEEE